MNTNLNNAIRTALAGIVASLKDAKDGKAAGGKASKSAVQHVREYASFTAEAGIAASDAAEVLNAAWKSTKLPAGTVKPYIAALRGYRQAIAEDVNIADVGEGKPMTAPVARTFNIPKDKRQAQAEIEDIRREIAKRVRAIENVADLIGFRDLLPEVEGEVKTVKAEPTAEDLLANLLGDGDEADVSEDVREAMAA